MPDEADTDEAMSLITTQLRDRLRPVGASRLPASATMPAVRQPPASGGAGIEGCGYAHPATS